MSQPEDPLFEALYSEETEEISKEKVACESLDPVDQELFEEIQVFRQSIDLIFKNKQALSEDMDVLGSERKSKILEEASRSTVQDEREGSFFNLSKTALRCLSALTKYDPISLNIFRTSPLRLVNLWKQRRKVCVSQLLIRASK